MTVGQLIEHLLGMDKDATVLIERRGSYPLSYREVHIPQYMEAGTKCHTSHNYYEGEDITAVEI